MALCAKEMHKPFYVLAESFKFVRLYPLNQRDLPQELKVCAEIFVGNIQFQQNTNSLNLVLIKYH